MLSGLLGQQIPIEFKVGAREEHGLAPIAALGDVMRQAGNDEAGHASHVKRIQRTGQPQR